MKSIIKKLLKDRLNEMITRPKEMFGLGSYHQIYQSKKNPDRLYKVGDKNTVDEWVKIFRKYPKYFPKIFRVFKSKAKGNIDIYIVEIERLETRSATMDLSMIDEYLTFNCDNIRCGKFGPNLHNFFEKECLGQIINQLEESDDTYDRVLKPIFVKWATFLREVYPTIQQEFKSMGGDGSRVLDLHVGNVAYDKNKNIKLIDI